MKIDPEELAQRMAEARQVDEALRAEFERTSDDQLFAALVGAARRVADGDREALSNLMRYVRLIPSERLGVMLVKFSVVSAAAMRFVEQLDESSSGGPRSGLADLTTDLLSRIDDVLDEPPAE